MNQDTNNCCRICLDGETEHVSILDPTIHLHLKSCLTITVLPNDCLPKVICGSCVTKLSEFYNFQLNARCSQDWLESSIQEKTKKSGETKTPIQPLPDSEYNSDSLLEFLNNTANIEEYLNNLGKEDIPSFVSLFERNESSLANNHIKPTKVLTPKKKEVKKNCNINMEIDVLDSEIEIVKEILMKETEPKVKVKSVEKSSLKCFACELKFDNIHKLSQHLSVCDAASRTCPQCNALFDSKVKMQQHYTTHSSQTLSCNCGKQFTAKEKLLHHQKTCIVDYGAAMGCSYRCKECGQIFKERVHLYKHAREHVLKSEEKICDICGHNFIGNNALAKHKKEKHEKPDDLMYRCKVCSFTSPDHKEIYLHVQKHTGSKKDPVLHLCESCGNSFASRSSLQRHTLQHEKSKEYLCNVCNRRFPNLKALDEHKLEHSIIIVCERCGQSVNSLIMDTHRCI